MDDLKKLDYIECVMKETLRILPSIPFFGRKLTDDLQVGKAEWVFLILPQCYNMCIKYRKVQVAKKQHGNDRSILHTSR